MAEVEVSVAPLLVPEDLAEVAVGALVVRLKGREALAVALDREALAVWSWRRGRLNP